MTVSPAGARATVTSLIMTAVSHLPRGTNRNAGAGKQLALGVPVGLASSTASTSVEEVSRETRGTGVHLGGPGITHSRVKPGAPFPLHESLDPISSGCRDLKQLLGPPQRGVAALIESCNISLVVRPIPDRTSPEREVNHRVMDTSLREDPSVLASHMQPRYETPVSNTLGALEPSHGSLYRRTNPPRGDRVAAMCHLPTPAPRRSISDTWRLPSGHMTNVSRPRCGRGWIRPVRLYSERVLLHGPVKILRNPKSTSWSLERRTPHVMNRMVVEGTRHLAFENTRPPPCTLR